MTAPGVDYRMTLRERREVEGLWRGHGEGAFASALLRFVPDRRVDGVQFAEALQADSPARPFGAVVRDGLAAAVARPRGGIPFTGVRAELLGVACGPAVAAAPATALTAAAGLAFALAAEGNRQLLEPLLQVAVEVPESCVGDVIGDLSSRRGIIDEMIALPGGLAAIRGRAPLVEMDAYVHALRSLTQDRATCRTQPAGHEPLPPVAAAQVLWDRDAFAAVASITRSAS
jgi:elongation factor G